MPGRGVGHLHMRVLRVLLLWLREALATLPAARLPAVATRALLPIGCALPWVVLPGAGAMRQRRLRCRHVKHIVWQGGRRVLQLARRACRRRRRLRRAWVAQHAGVGGNRAARRHTRHHVALPRGRVACLAVLHVLLHAAGAQHGSRRQRGCGHIVRGRRRGRAAPIHAPSHAKLLLGLLPKGRCHRTKLHVRADAAQVEGGSRAGALKQLHRLLQTVRGGA